VFERYQAVLREDEAVVITGKISIREDEAPKLLADRIVPMEEWRKEQKEPGAARRPAGVKTETKTDAQRAAASPRKLFLRLDRGRMDQATALLSLHQGPIPVYMHLPAERMTLLAPGESWCDGSEACLTRLREALGAENVVIRG